MGDPRACRIAQCRTKKKSKKKENTRAPGVRLSFVGFSKLSWRGSAKRAAKRKQSKARALLLGTIRGLGVPFVGNDKNKASNHTTNPLSLPLPSLTHSSVTRRKERERGEERGLYDTTNGEKQRTKWGGKRETLSLFPLFVFLFSSNTTHNFYGPECGRTTR